jgi:peptidoglycan hydrolase CwlO-like protein
LRAAKNEVESLNRRIDSMNNVLESKKKEIQNKDEFIKQYLISTNKNNDIGFLLSQL